MWQQRRKLKYIEMRAAERIMNSEERNCSEYV